MMLREVDKKILKEKKISARIDHFILVSIGGLIYMNAENAIRMFQSDKILIGIVDIILAGMWITWFIGKSNRIVREIKQCNTLKE